MRALSVTLRSCVAVIALLICSEATIGIAQTKTIEEMMREAQQGLQQQQKAIRARFERAKKLYEQGKYEEGGTGP